MPDYDKLGSPWKKLGLGDLLEERAENDIEQDAMEALRKIPALSFANTEFEIILDETEDWE
jgi:hypothetical protein